MNTSAILIAVIYSNGNRKIAAIISFYLLLSPYNCMHFLSMFFSFSLLCFCIYFLFVDLLLFFVRNLLT